VFGSWKLSWRSLPISWATMGEPEVMSRISSDKRNCRNFASGLSASRKLRARSEAANPWSWPISSQALRAPPGFVAAQLLVCSCPSSWNPRKSTCIDPKLGKPSSDLLISGTKLRKYLACSKERSTQYIDHPFTTVVVFQLKSVLVVPGLKRQCDITPPSWYCS
jgi:hypothetical protein